MDGGSTDETAAIASEYSSRLTWVSEKDRGQAHAINKGFQRARGEVVAWLNSDDILLPGAVRRAVAELARAPRAGGVYGEGYLIDRQGRMTGRFPATEPFNLWKLTYLSDYILQQSTFFRRDAVEQVGWLDESLHYTMDWDLLIRLGKRFGLRYVPEYLGALREYPEAKSFSGGLRRIEEIRRVLERHTGLRRAPGYWTYGLDTWHRLCQKRLGGPASPLGWITYLPSAVAIRLILRHAQGLYFDRWASDRLKWMLPEGCGDVLLRGTVPPDPRLAGQHLTVTANGRQLGAWRVGPGDFEARFRVDTDKRSPTAFEVCAARYTRPALGTERSLRRKAFILRSLTWAVDAPSDE